MMRTSLSRLAGLAGLLLAGACAGEATAPAAKPASRTPEAASGFSITDPSKVLYGVADGVYSVTVNPAYNQTLNLGPNRLELPANSICRLAGSGYGSAYWNAPCTPETQNVTITVVVKDAASDHPRVDFYPAMRFNPSKTVQLFMYVPNATQQDAHNWLMQYCNDANVCVDESKADRDLTSYVDRYNHVVFRRIKHFSGYVVAEFNDTTPTGY